MDCCHNGGVTQERLSKKDREDRAADELAARLDALSRPLAERVLGRAIELDHEAREAAEEAASTIDYETLKDVALEVGISEDSLKKALLEELDTEKDHDATPVEKLTIPDVIRGGAIVPGTGDAVMERLQQYMAEVEGLAEGERSGPLVVWRRPTAGMPRRVETRVVPQTRGDRQLIEVDVSTSPTRRRGWAWFISILVIAALLGTPLGGFVFLGLLVAGVVTVGSWIKRVARKARRTVNHVLGAFADEVTQSNPEWLDIWERLKD